MTTRSQPIQQPGLSPPVSGGLVQRQCACGQHTVAGGECAICRKNREGGRRREDGSPVLVEEVLRSPGVPLDIAIRGNMESRFQHDFSRVRVHVDSRAARSARTVNALAYSVGRDIVFDAGHFAPHTKTGRQLLATSWRTSFSKAGEAL
jgi:hypothetical protein